jgi:SAM-dependent methyltransferase
MRFPDDVSGWLTREEGKALHSLAAGRHVLEVGSFQGRSTIYLAQSALRVVSVDHHQGDADSGKGGTLEAFKANLERYGVADKVEAIVQPFASASLKRDSFDLVFIDAAHDENSAAHDAAKGLAMATPGGVIALHDWADGRVRRGARNGNPLFAHEPHGKTGENLAWWRVPEQQSIYLCIPSRDGKFDDDVLMRAHSACQHAVRRGMNCELARVKDRYTVATCRNRAVAGFLETKFDAILFVDDDVKIPGETLMELADTLSRHRGIVTGCIPSVRIDDQGNTAGYVQVKPVGAKDWLKKWPAEEMEAEACGGGCMLIPREVFAAVGFPWFRWPETYREGIGVRANTDDADFCERARAAGFQVWANPKVRCGHMKEIDVACLIGGT